MNKIPPSITALLLQLLSFMLVVLFMRGTNLSMPPFAIALTTGMLATAFSYFTKLARWWLFIQFLFVPTLVVMLQLNIPSSAYLIAFFIMLLVFWSTFRTQVPLYLSSKKVWQTLEELLPPENRNTSFKFLDIGSGMGGVLIHLAKVRPDGLYFGIENAPLPFAFSFLKIKLKKHNNCHVLWGNFWSYDLSQYDVVFAYLSPVPMEQLWIKVKTEMRPGTLFISNSFPVAQHPPQYSITLDDLHHSTLYIWHM